MKQRLTRKLYSDQSPYNFKRILADTGDYLALDSANSNAIQISDGADPSNDECPHSPCVIDYLFVDTCFEFQPSYGGNSSYILGTDMLKYDAALLNGVNSGVIAAAAGLDVNDANVLFWTGNDSDRTDTGNIGFLLVLAWTQATAEIVQEELCEVASGTSCSF